MLAPGGRLVARCLLGTLGTLGFLGTLGTIGTLGSFAQSARFVHSFSATAHAEIIATITVRCDRCAWDTAGREAVVLKITRDGTYVQHLPVVRTGRADYQVLIGEVTRGPHTIAIDEDLELTARDLRGGAARIESVTLREIPEHADEFAAVSFAPILYARANTVGRFTDVPLFMWYEVEPTARGTRYRYSIIFSNEDGGTPADRLMATWGRTTDIEYVYSIEVDRSGAVIAADMQGPEHEILPFRGTRESLHPLLWVATDNNMVLDRGTTTVRYAPAPVRFPLRDVSREAVMDAHPWTYAVASRELIREGKIAAGVPGPGQIADPRRFVYVEGCGELNGSALALALRVKNEWIASDRAGRQYRIARDGCFRAAIPLPSPLTARDVTALRAQAYTRPASDGTPPPPAGAVRLTRINRVFTLDDEYRPQPPLLQWAGTRTIEPDGPPVEIATPHE